jgi:hydrogenase maturation protein HypF
VSGGVFQNRLLMRLTLPRLQAAGFEVLLHRQVPCNDGGVSLGQAVLARSRVKAPGAKDPGLRYRAAEAGFGC